MRLRERSGRYIMMEIQELKRLSWELRRDVLEIIIAGGGGHIGGDMSLLNALLAGPPADEVELTGIIPAGTRVLSWSLEDRVANVELSAAYAELVGVDLTLADYCITLTLAQLPGVDGVRVTASGAGQSYRERHVLYPGDVLFSGAEETPVEVTAALYFRREGGDSLGFELRVFRLTQDKVPARAVLEALLAGPKEEGLAPLLPAGLSVRSVWVDSGVCCADLSAQLLELPEEERGQAVDAIVATLCSLDTVEQEPFDLNNPLLAMENVLETPHIGGATREASTRSSLACAQAVDDYFSGRTPKFIVPELRDLA